MPKQLIKTYPVTGMHCAGCAANVQRILSKQPGVVDANVNIATNSAQLTLTSDCDLNALQQSVEAGGYHLIVTDNEEEATDQKEEADRQYLQTLSRNTIGSWLLLIPIMAFGMIWMHSTIGAWISFAATTLLLIFFGNEFYINAWKQLKQRSSNMDTLVALSTLIAYLFSTFNIIYPQFWTVRGMEAHLYFEAAGGIIAFILLGKYLEERAKHKTSSAIRELMGMQPNTAYLIRDGVEQEVSIQHIVPGDQIRVHPGERIPVDGIVSDGHSFVDESMISGEPIALEKYRGKRVIAGTINQKGSFLLIAQQVGKDTLLAHIIETVKQAQGSKAPVQRLVDRVSRIFVPTVIGIALLTLLVWLIIGGIAALPHALVAAVSVLVIACPCALGLATPTALMVGIGKAAQDHILIKDAIALEKLGTINTIVLDKTGTITQGRPIVDNSRWYHEADLNDTAVYAEIERRSEHPLASAVTTWLATDLPIELTHFESITGKGVQAQYNQITYWIGNKDLAAAHGVNVSHDIDDWIHHGETIVYLGKGDRMMLALGLRDLPREHAHEVIATLKGMGIETHLLSGDHEASVRHVANTLNITHYKAGVLPQDKENYIRRLQQDGKHVAMIGDGINDSQALAIADVSIAMGQGTDIAMDIAMATIINSNLLLLPQAVKLSRNTIRTIKQNLFWAFVYNLIGIPIAAGLFYPLFGWLLNPMYAAAAMALSSVSVVSNSLLLKTKR